MVLRVAEFFNRYLHTNVLKNMFGAWWYSGIRLNLMVTLALLEKAKGY